MSNDNQSLQDRAANLNSLPMGLSNSSAQPDIAKTLAEALEDTNTWIDRAVTSGHISAYAASAILGPNRCLLAKYRSQL